MNILMVTSNLNVLRDKSPARVEMEKYAALTKHLVVIVLNTSRDHYPIQKVSESLLILPTNAPVFLLAPLIALRLVRRELYFQGHLQADLVEAFDPGIAGFVAWLICRNFHPPFLLHIPRNILTASYGNQSLVHELHRKLGQFLVRKAQALVINSEGTRASLAEISVAIADRAMMAPHFMDIESFQNEPVRVDLTAKYPQFKIIMLVVAPLEKSSNVQLAITILAGIVRLYPHAGLVIVGEGALSGKLHAYAKKIGMAEHVAFEASTDNLSSYFKTSRIFLVTAPYEEYGDTIALAAAASCAIVSTKVGIAPTIIEDSVSGFLCESDDGPRFVASIILMIRKPATCDSIRLNANLAIQKYMNSDEAAYLNFGKESWEKTISLAAQERR